MKEIEMVRKKKTPTEVAAEAAAATTTSDTKACPICKSPAAGDATRCTECGYYFSGTPETGDVRQYTPDELVEGRNSRVIAEQNYLDTVVERAVSLFIDGQIADAEAFFPGGDAAEKPVLISGYTRRDAIRLINEGFEAIHPITGEKTRFQDTERKLRVRIVNITPDQAFLRSIKENIERKNTTDLQEAKAQDVLRAEMGWSDARIARFYNYTNQNRVMLLKRLLKLDEPTQNKVHAGNLSASAAVLLDNPSLSDEEKKKIIDGATDGDKVRGEVIRDLLRETLLAKAEAKAGAVAGRAGGEGEGGEGDDEGDEEPKPSVLKRSRTDLINWLDAVEADEENAVPEPVAVFLDTLKKWLNGTRKDAYLKGKLAELAEAVS